MHILCITGGKPLTILTKIKSGWENENFSYLIKLRQKDMIVVDEIHHIQAEKEKKEVHSRVLEANENQVRSESSGQKEGQREKAPDSLKLATSD